MRPQLLLKLWGSAYWPPILLGASLAWMAQTFIPANYVTSPWDRVITSEPPVPQGVEPDFLAGFDVIDFTTQLDPITGLSPSTALVVLDLDSDLPGSSSTPPRVLTCHCLRCYDRRLHEDEPQHRTPLGIHVLFETLGRRSPLWEWIRSEFVGRSRRVILCERSLAHRVWAAHQKSKTRRSEEGLEAHGSPLIHLW